MTRSAGEAAALQRGATEAKRARRAKPRSKREAAERLAAADRALALLLPFKALNEMAVEAEAAAAGVAPESVGTSPLTGDALPPHDELRAIRLANLRRAFAARQTLLADALSVNDVAGLLRVGRQTPHDRRLAGTLLAVKDRGQWRFPAWQFDADGPDGVLQGLPEASRSLRAPMSDVGRVRWFTTPKPLLSGRTPLDALRSGDIEAVIAEAEAVGAS
jgi:hypothetical protein